MIERFPILDRRIRNPDTVFKKDLWRSSTSHPLTEIFPNPARRGESIGVLDRGVNYMAKVNLQRKKIADERKLVLIEQGRWADDGGMVF